MLLFEVGDVGLVPVLEDLQQELILRPEVVEDSGVGHPHLVRDVLERSAGESLAAEDLDRGVEDVAPAGEGLGPGARLPSRTCHDRRPLLVRVPPEHRPVSGVYPRVRRPWMTHRCKVTYLIVS